MAGGGHDRSRRVAGGGQPVGGTDRLQRSGAALQQPGRGLGGAHVGQQLRPDQSAGLPAGGHRPHHLEPPFAGQLDGGVGQGGPARPARPGHHQQAARATRGTLQQVFQRPQLSEPPDQVHEHRYTAPGRAASGRGRFNVRPTA
jgi:hypothetical protein